MIFSVLAAVVLFLAGSMEIIHVLIAFARRGGSPEKAYILSGIIGQ